MNITRRSWRDLAPNLADTLNRFSIFTSPGFVLLFETLDGSGGYYLVEQDGQVIAALPIVEFGRPPFRRLQALTDGLYAPVWIDESRRADALPLAHAILERIATESYLKSIITDFDNQLSPKRWQSLEMETSLVDLHLDDSAGEWLPPDKTLCAEIAKADRDGVAVIPINSDTHMASFLSLMRKTEARHGRPQKYPEPFWRGLAELSAHDPRILWLGVETSGQLACSHIYLIDRRAALNWQIYFDKQYSPLKPNQAIMFQAAKRLKKAGVGYLNLGSTPPEATGVASYKEKWGGRAYRYRVWKRTSFLGRWQ
ncbi:MAG: GNAT family N-acetyltransferase [candidate division Zixibacteria bacterium]|nr:GNAT family N-acetyltransferase [candidate division Zixibacteria bacterium]